jgi:hypothetical protein
MLGKPSPPFFLGAWAIDIWFFSQSRQSSI